MWIAQTRWNEATGWRVLKSFRNGRADLGILSANGHALRCMNRCGQLGVDDALFEAGS